MLLSTTTSFAILAMLATSGAAPIKRAEGVPECHRCTESSGEIDVLGKLANPLHNALNLGSLTNNNAHSLLNSERPGPGANPASGAPLIELLPGKPAGGQPGVVDGVLGNSPLRVLPFNGPGEKIAGVNLGNNNVDVNLPHGNVLGQINNGAGPGEGHGAGAPIVSDKLEGAKVTDLEEELGFGRPAFMLARPLLNGFMGSGGAGSGSGTPVVGNAQGLPDVDLNNAKGDVKDVVKDSPDVKDVNIANGNEPDVDVAKHENETKPQEQPKQEQPKPQEPKEEPKAQEQPKPQEQPKAQAQPKAQEQPKQEQPLPDVVDKLKLDDKPAEVQTTTDKVLGTHDQGGDKVDKALDKVGDKVAECLACKGSADTGKQVDEVKNKLSALHLDAKIDGLTNDLLGKTSHLLSLFSPSHAFHGPAQCATAAVDQLPQHTVPCDDKATGKTAELCIPEHLYTQRPHDTIACPADLQKDVLGKLLKSRDTANDEDWDMLSAPGEETKGEGEGETVEESMPEDETEQHAMDKRDALAFVKLCLTANLKL